MTLLDKVTDIHANMSCDVRELSACKQVSRTKAYIQEAVSSLHEDLEKQVNRIDGYRNTLEHPIELGDPENTLRQDLWSIVEAIGDAQYHLMHNDILNASIVLSEISRVIKGS